MKAKYFMLGLCLALTPLFLLAQTTTGLNYQAVLRSSTYQAISNQSGTAVVSILNGSTELYREIHVINTDQLGLFNLIIGKGNALNGNFANLDWGGSGRSVKVVVSVGGNTYDFAPTELQAVPYAKVAERSLQPGPAGAKGDKGDTGATGAQGLKGDKGDKGDTGAQGPKGDKGDKGDIGATGAQGPTGSAGATGAQGPKGDKGDKGDAGATGAQGPTGSAGATGAQGPKGDKGDKGDTGATGAQGPTGSAGATGAQGPKGDKGDKGDAGATGAQGPTGSAGATGAQGPKGDKGDKGDTGATGAQGPAGSAGATGAQGPKGDKGDKGDTGATGPAGTYTPGSGISIAGNLISNTGDADASPTNELQTLSLSGNTLSLSNNGGSVLLPTGSSVNPGEGLSFSGNILNSTWSVVNTGPSTSFIKNNNATKKVTIGADFHFGDSRLHVIGGDGLLTAGHFESNTMTDNATVLSSIVSGTGGNSGNNSPKAMLARSVPSNVFMSAGQGVGVGLKAEAGYKGIWAEQLVNPSSQTTLLLNIYDSAYGTTDLNMAGYFKSQSSVGLLGSSNAWHTIRSSAIGKTGSNINLGAGLVGLQTSTGNGTYSVGVLGVSEGSNTLTNVGLMGISNPNQPGSGEKIGVYGYGGIGAHFVGDIGVIGESKSGGNAGFFSSETPANSQFPVPTLVADNAGPGKAALFSSGNSSTSPIVEILDNSTNGFSRSLNLNTNSNNGITGITFSNNNTPAQWAITSSQSARFGESYMSFNLFRDGIAESSNRFMYFDGNTGNVGIGPNVPSPNLYRLFVDGEIQSRLAIRTINNSLSEVTYMGSNIENTGGYIATINGANTQPVSVMTNVFAQPSKGFVYVSSGAALKAYLWVDNSNRGSVVAEVKNFRMDDPDNSNREIWYACIEGPEAAAYARGTGTLKKGTAEIKFDRHFEVLATPNTMTVVLTALSAKSEGLAVVKKTAQGFVVQELRKGKGNYSFDWEVKCVRKGFEDYRVYRDKSESRPAEIAKPERKN